MTSSIRYPRALLEWLAKQPAHLARLTHDGRGNYTAFRIDWPDRRHYFPADDHVTPSPDMGGNDAQGMQPAPLKDAQAPAAAEMTPAEKHAAEVRGSYPDLSA
ncbi:hypothetical protein CK216_05695 [Mesorhizobium sp. WSM3876]|nr:hypothetical protein CK216_05695 [Mesorhizobium sp. WSM3876]